MGKAGLMEKPQKQEKGNQGLSISEWLRLEGTLKIIVLQPPVVPFTAEATVYPEETPLLHGRWWKVDLFHLFNCCTCGREHCECPQATGVLLVLGVTSPP